MEKKFRLLENDAIIIGGITLYRIEALKDFGNIKKGDKGGYIAYETNLSQKGNCWVAKNAKVCGFARVHDNAQVLDYARVFGNACLRDN